MSPTQDESSGDRRARIGTASCVGAALLVFSTLQFFIVHLIVQSAWTVVPYSWWNNYLSDLGAVHCGDILGNMVCSPRHALMNTSIVIQGAGLIVGTLLVTRAWRPEHRLRVWHVLIAVAGMSWVLVGFVPEDTNLVLHSIFAFPVLLAGNAALLAAGLSASTRHQPALRRAATVLGSLGLLGIILIIIAKSAADGVGAAERLAVFPLQIWVMAWGFILLTTGRRIAIFTTKVASKQ